MCDYKKIYEYEQCSLPSGFTLYNLKVSLILSGSLEIVRRVKLQNYWISLSSPLQDKVYFLAIAFIIRL